MAGGELHFTMGARANTAWPGRDAEPPYFDVAGALAARRLVDGDVVVLEVHGAAGGFATRGDRQSP